MSLKWKEIELVLAEMKPFLVGASIQKIFEIDAQQGGPGFLLHGYGARGAFRLWINLAMDRTCTALLSDAIKPQAEKEPSTFVMVLRKHLVGKSIETIEQVGGDRIFVIHFAELKSLLVELIPRRGNLILLENWDIANRQAKCVANFQRVSLKTGALYELPSAPAQVLKADVRPELLDAGGEALALNHWVAESYWQVLQENQFEGLKRAWRQSLKSQRKKLHSALENSQRDQAEAEEAELFQRRGKALFAKLYELGPQNLPKMKSIAVEYETETGVQSVTVPLDPSKSYAENAEFCFKKSKKFTRAVGELAEIVDELSVKLQNLDGLMADLEASTDEAGLAHLEAKCARLGLAIAPGSAADQKSSEAKPFLEVQSSDGFRILCGRNQEENRRVTFKECRGNDMWMHAKGVPGAHVAILAQKNKTIPLQTLLEAAQVTAYHSKVRDGRKVDIDYTLRKYVKPIKGTLAEVSYTENKTLYLEADIAAYRKLLGKA